MSFSETLNSYIADAGCTARELSEISCISETVISRYRNGSRIPNEKQLLKLSEGLSLLSGKQKEEIFSSLQMSYRLDTKNNVDISKAFSFLIDEYSINMTDLAKSLSFDSSYLSRIKNGQRRPLDINSFVSGVSQYIASRYGANASEIEKQLLGVTVDTHNYTSDFLAELDNFNLNAYLKEVHFDDIKIPNIPLSFVRSRTATDIETMKETELVFYKATVLSKSSEPVWIYSDFPIEEFGKDEEFRKKIMIGLALCIKKGLHINIIHDIERPYTEMMIGLISWIPLYMTGQISPYYLPNYSHTVFHHFLRSSGACAMEGDCIGENVAEGRYHLATGRKEMDYIRKKTECLFKEARPLMNIYTGSELQIVERLLSSGDYKQIDEGEKYPFQNISIYVQKGKTIIIRKKNAPDIAFVIHQQKLVSAIANYFAGI